MTRARLAITGAIAAIAIAATAFFVLRTRPRAADGERDLVVVGGWEQAMPVLDRLARERGYAIGSVRQNDLAKNDWQARFGHPRLVLVLNASGENVPALQEFLTKEHAAGGRILALDQRPWQGALIAAGVVERDEKLQKYWRAAGSENLSRMLDYLGATYLGRKATVEPPLPQPTKGFYHPDAPHVLATAAEVDALPARRAKLPPDAPRVAYAIHASFLVFGDVADTDAVVRAFEARGLAIYPVFAEKEDELRRLLVDLKPDLLVTQRHTGVGRPADGGPTIPETLGVPYLKAIGALQTSEDEWRRSPLGLAPGDVAGQVVAQELEGTIEPVVISAPASVGEYHLARPIQERVEHFADRAASWVALERTPAAEKRVAIVTYDADLDAGSLTQGSASGMFLDAPESLVRFTRALAAAGYRLTPFADRAEVIAKMRASGRNLGPWAQDEIDRMAAAPDAILVNARDYATWLARDLPDSLQQQMIAVHGPPPGKLMVTTIHGEPEIVIPHVSLGGNVSLFTQPEKGARQDARLVHDRTAPPSHAYVAEYLYFREVLRPHALVHFGTHGTLELLPRRAIGLGPDDFADALLGTIPNVNPWILDNVGEASLARRRAYAVLVDHLVPAIERTETNGAMKRLHEDVEKAASLEAGPVRDRFAARIVAAMKANAYALDLLRDDRLDDAALTELGIRLDGLEEEVAPKSLHVLGEVPPRDRRVGFVTSILGKPFVARAGSRARAEAIVGCAIDSTAACAAGDELADDVATARRLDADLRRAPDEIGHVLDALAGKYVPPGPGNDPVRNPAALPTGRDLYALDPETIPSGPAMEVGALVANELVDTFRKDHAGAYPHKVAVNVNGMETMRDTGVTEGEVLALLGVAPVRDDRGLVTKVTLVPRDVLGRPRVDVVLAISGNYRDNFPTRVKLLDRAVKLAASAREDDNAVAADTQRARAELLAKGLPAERAEALAATRIYGAPPGQYGTQLLYLLPRSGAWEDRDEVRRVYEENMRFAYGEGTWGEESPEGYAAALAGTDAVSHVWSSNVLSPLTNHHVYEYLGGLTMAVEHATGKAPETLVADARQPGAARTRKLAEVLSTEEQTRLFNEAWIESMRADDYAGAGHVAAYVENLFGWSTTTPGAVDPRTFERIDAVYVRDEGQLGTRKWLEEKSPDALASITVTLLEAARRGYWKPSAQARERLVADYLTQVAARGLPDGMMAGGNQHLRDFVKETYGAPGSKVAAAAIAAYEQAVAKHDAAEEPAEANVQAALSRVAAPTERLAPKVDGVVMQRSPVVSSSPPLGLALLAGGGLVGAIGVGLLAGARRQRARKRDAA